MGARELLSKRMEIGVGEEVMSMSTYEGLKQLLAEVIDPWAWAEEDNPDYKTRLLYSRVRADKALHIIWEQLKAPSDGMVKAGCACKLHGFFDEAALGMLYRTMISQSAIKAPEVKK